MATIRTISPTVPQTGRQVGLVINGLASHFKGRMFTVHRLADGPGALSVQTGAGGPGVAPGKGRTGAYYETDLGLGLTETADDITIKSAVCKVTLKKTIVSTAIAGHDGTVKECISAQDYEIEASFALINTVDEYPAEAMRRLSDLARKNSAVYIDSAFLRLFDIDRAVVATMEVSQETYGNTQSVLLKLDSDDDYEVEVTQTV